MSDLQDLEQRKEAYVDMACLSDFYSAMANKLEQKRNEGRAGWSDKKQCSQEHLSQLLLAHVEKGDPVDVANLAMMLWARGERIVIPEGNQIADAMAEIARLQRELSVWQLALKTVGLHWSALLTDARRAMCEHPRAKPSDDGSHDPGFSCPDCGYGT